MDLLQAGCRGLDMRVENAERVSGWKPDSISAHRLRRFSGAGPIPL